MEALKLEVDNTSQNESEGFVVDNDKKATWCLRKIKHMTEKQSENEKLAKEQIAEIEEEIKEVRRWLEEENSRLDNNIGFMETKLENYAHRLREDDPDLKTHKLPFGSLKFRAQRPKWKYDDDKLLNFAEDAMADVIKIKKKVDKRKLKKRLEVVDGKAIIKDTGEIVEGIKVTDRPEKFKVDISSSAL